MKHFGFNLNTLLLVYFSLTILTLVSWNWQERYPITGDEPHYLVVAKGIFTHGQLEQTLPYQEEFATRAIYQGGMAPADAIPTLKNTHAVQGPHGLYSVHNLGLPLLVGLPFLIGGIWGVKLFMITLNALAVVFSWKFSGLFTPNGRLRFYATLLTAIAMPIIPASNQIFPDLLAGIIALSGLYWLFSLEKPRPFPLLLIWMGCMAFLPWLQIKFAPTMLILGGSIIYAQYQRSREFRHTLYFALLLLIPLVLLLYYNHYAFGKLSGPYPYRGASLEFSMTAAVVLLGLHIDQNHGFLFQNPILFIGIAALGLFFKQHKYKAWVWLLVYLSLIVPNGLHNAWYGGYSIMGRFGWSATLVFFIPTLLGLVQLARLQPRLFSAVITLGLSLQLYFYFNYAIKAVELYNVGYKFIDEYPALYYPVYQWLPILFRPAWAYNHPPNLGWLLITTGIFLAGWLAASRRVNFTPRLQATLLASAITILLVGRLYVPTQPPITRQFDVSLFNSKTGHVEGNARVATAGSDQPSHLAFGPAPYTRLPQGTYQLSIHYQLDLPANTQGGNWDIYDVDQRSVFTSGSLEGTAGKPTTLNTRFELPAHTRDKYEFRVYWNGKGDIRLQDMALQALPPSP